VTTQIEHKAVLEPIERLQKEGFEVDLVPPDRDGWVNPKKIKNCLRPDTLVVAMMHANNETGVIQPLPEVIGLLMNHPAYLFVDAAQTYGKIDGGLSHSRVDMLSVSAHKIYGPKGIGGLVLRRRGFESIPLEPLMVGGGQERGLRPGTLPVHLIVGFGKAAELAIQDQKKRMDACAVFRTKFFKNIQPLKPAFQGDPTKTLKHTANISFPGINSEAAMVALKDIVAVSNGSACTSASYKPSHVLKAMGLKEDQILGAIRFSWSHLTPVPDWAGIRAALAALQ
jgi:cysteine desulfurase